MTLEALVQKYHARKKRLTYKTLIKEITAHNTEKITRAMGKLSDTRYRRAATRALGKEGLKLPAWETVVPPRAVFLKKAMDSGEVITDTLRRRLTSALREEMSTMKGSERMNPAVIDRFEKRVRETMNGYTKSRDGAPPNARAIAVTEARSAFDEAKYQYARALVAADDRVELRKVWKHNDSLVREGRPGHKAADGTSVGFTEAFTIQEWQKAGGRWVKSYVVKMMHPHDPSAPIGSVVACQCDYDIVVTRKDA
jgi:hypothetical protein